MRISRPLATVAAAVSVLLATACGYAPTPVPTAETTSAATSAPSPPPAPTCENATQSYDPLAPMPAPGAEVPQGDG